MRLQQIDDLIDGPGRDLRLVAFHVDEDLDMGQLLRRCRDALRSAGQLGLGKNRLSAEAFDQPLQPLTVHRHGGTVRTTGGSRRFVGVLQQRFACLPQQQLFWQPSRRQSRRNDDLAAGEKTGKGDRADFLAGELQ